MKFDVEDLYVMPLSVFELRETGAVKAILYLGP